MSYLHNFEINSVFFLLCRPEALRALPTLSPSQSAACQERSGHVPVDSVVLTRRFLCTETWLAASSTGIQDSHCSLTCAFTTLQKLKLFWQQALLLLDSRWVNMNWQINVWLHICVYRFNTVFKIGSDLLLSHVTIHPSLIVVLWGGNTQGSP